MKLWKKLTIIFIALAIIPVLIIGYLAYDVARRTIEDRAINHLVSTNILKSSELDRWIQNNENSIEELAQRPLMRQYTEQMTSYNSTDPLYAETRKLLVENHLKPHLEYGGFFELFIMDSASGIIMTTTDEQQLGKQRFDSQYFVEGKSGTFVEGIYYSVPMHEPAMTIGTPIRDSNNNVIAVLAGRLDLSEMSVIMEQQSGLSQTEDTYLVNTSNLFVTEPRFGDDYALKKAVHTEGVEAGLAGNEGTGFYDDYRGVPVIGAYNWLPEYEMCIITEIDQSEAFAPIVQLGQITTIIVLIIVVIVILLALFIARTITRPMHRLAEGAEIIGSGNLDYKLSVTGKDEIGDLSRAFNDMTEKLKLTTVSRDELAQSEQRYRSTLDNMMEGCQIIGFDMKYLYLNDAAVAHSRKTREELLGHTMMEMYPGIENTEMFAHLKQCMEERIPHHMENEFAYPDGNTGWFELSIQPMNEGVSVLSWDITDRKRAELALIEVTSWQQALLSAMPEIVMQTDMNRVYTWADQAGIEFFGDDVIGKEAAFYFEGEQDTYDIVRPLFDGEEGTIYVESWQRRRDGEIRLLAWWCRVLKDKEGNVTGALSTARDITEMKRVEEEIRKLNTELEQRVQERTAQLEATNKELEAFAYSVSHDLRAPLRAIDGYTRILLEDYESKLDDEGKRICSIIRDNTHNMGSLIDDLLAFSRLGRAEMQFRKIDLATMAKSIFAELTGPEERKRIDFQVDSIPPVYGDTTLMRQVWTNLLSNAIKFSSRKKKPVIVVQGKRNRSENEYVIQDNGAGFDMRYVHKLFGVFQRLHSTSEFEGNGVGLAIVQRVIHRHGGRVWAEGDIDRGAEFHFTLPSKGGR
jgi:PAS domain S-box-containing protein